MRQKICVVLTSPFALKAFLLPHIEALPDFEITICVNVSELNVPLSLPAGVHLAPIPISRSVSAVADLVVLMWLWRFLRSGKFDIVLSLTPKGGLLGMLAARAAGNRIRVHCFTGQVWATKRGAARQLLRLVDMLLAWSATHLLADSASQREFLLENRVVAPGKIKVLGNGSMAGVEMDRFRPDEEARRNVRSRLGIPDGATCLLYVGRLKIEKGVPDLLAAFGILSKRYPALHLILAGPDDENLLASIEVTTRLHVVGYTGSPEHYMAAADIFCLPSYREGFGQVVIEAAAVGLPVVASRIYGLTDAVVDGVSGLLHEPRSIEDIVKKLDRLVADATYRKTLAKAGRSRVAALFSRDMSIDAMRRFINQVSQN
jgi:glycosyltransferase involved in cell wall biosynthesis